MSEFINGSQCNINWRGLWYCVDYETFPGDTLDILRVESVSKPGADLWSSWPDDQREEFTNALEANLKEGGLE